MKTTVFSVLIAILSFLPAFASQDVTVQQIMQLHRRAIGGIDAITTYPTAHLKYSVTVNGEDAGTKDVYFGEGVLYREISKNGTRWRSISFDGDFAYLINTSTRRARSPHGSKGRATDVYYFDTTRTAALLFPLMYAEQLGAILSMVDSPPDTYSIKATYPDGASRIFVLNESKQIFRDTFSNKTDDLELVITRTYQGYKDFKGAILPSAVGIIIDGKMIAGGAERKINQNSMMRLVSVKENLRFNADFFTPGFPERVIAGTVVEIGTTSFQYAGEFPVGDDPESVRAADLDGDNNIDLITGDDGTVSFLLGDGTGGFPSRNNLPAGGGSNEYALPVDLDGDSILDLAVASTSAPASTLYLSKGLGGGRFIEPALVKTGDFPEAIAAADFDSDGHLDLAIPHNRSGDAWLHFGDGKGGIAESIVMKLGRRGENLAVADLNEDTHPDLMVVDQQKLFVFMNKGGREFEAAVIYDAGPFPFCVEVADFNNDGHIDVLVGNGGIFQDCGDKDLALLSGNGDGSLSVPTFISAGASITSISIKDLDNDGSPDASISSFGSHEAIILLNRGALTSAGALPCSWSPSAITISDFNNDSVPDIAVANEFADSVTIWLGVKR